MASGMEMMMASLIKGIGIDPDQFKEKVGQIGETVIAFQAQMTRIENQNAEILSILKGNEHGAQAQITNGSGSRKSGGG